MKQSYFLGCSGASGFTSDFEKVINSPGYYTYILKGGPGTGKSTLMKKIASVCDDSSCELYYCSSDIRSLDAVVLNDKKIIIADGTAPHTFDPVLPGISQEIINLGCFWNKKELLSHEDLIRYYFSENSLCHQRADRYIKAVSSLVNGIYTAGYAALDKEKLKSYAKRMVSGLTGRNEKRLPVNPQYRQLSAFTSHGYITRELPEKYIVYTLKDDLFAGTDFLLKTVSDMLSSMGYKVFISRCTAFEDNVYEHILIPEINTAFMSSGFFSCYTNDASSEINFRRFYDRKIISEKKSYISFNKKAVNEITKAVTETIDTALKIHDELEKYYISSLDTEKLNEFTEKFAAEILYSKNTDCCI